MKKILFLIVLFLLLGSVSLADSIGDINVSFCNSGSDVGSLNFAVQAGIPYEFCVNFHNTSIEKTPLSIGFVDGELTNDELHNKACSYKGTLFAPYVDFSTKNILIASGSIIQKTGIILFPLGYSGEIHGCLVYTIPNKTSSIEQGGSLFNVVVRKAKFIDGYVVGNFVRSLLLETGTISYYLDNTDDSLVISLPFVNSGTIPEYIQFTGILSNSLGYQRLVNSFKILTGSSSLEFRFSDIPFYKGNYEFIFEGSSVLDTKLDISNLQDDAKKTLIFSYQKTLFLVPWFLLFGIVGFFVALFVLRWLLKMILRR